MRDVLFPAGYVEVKTPLVYNKALWETSGHWEHYRENMFLIEVAKARQMSVKADELSRATILRLRERGAQLPRSADPLPRADAAAPQRSVGRARRGLTRVRQFSQDDAHCFVTQEQIGDEVERLLRLVQRVYGDFGLPYTAKLSTRPDGVPGRDRDVGLRPRRS